MLKNTELAIMPTYGCNDRCQMCHIWKHPSQKKDEITLENMDQHPEGSARVNIVGIHLVDRLT